MNFVPVADRLVGPDTVLATAEDNVAELLPVRVVENVVDGPGMNAEAIRK